MRKTEAIQEASKAFESALHLVQHAIAQLGSIRRVALSDGWTNQVRKQLGILKGVEKEIRGFADCIDWDVADPEDLKTLGDKEDETKTAE
jgi:hypothetical protein